VKTWYFVGTEIFGVGKVCVDKYLKKLNTRNRNNKYGNVNRNLKLKLYKHELSCWNCFVRLDMDLEKKNGKILIDLHTVFIM
jgi:hypothetical protein